MVFIAGRAGAGKTTLGEHFKTRSDFIHFDADQFAYGNHAVNDSGRTIQAKDRKKRSQKLVDVYDNLAVKEGYYQLFKGETPDLSVWTPFYDLLIAEIMKTKMKYQNKNIAISQSIYPRSVRDYIRKKCDKYNTYFIILYPKLELSTQRVSSRTYDLAAEIGKTVDEYLKDHGTTLKKLQEETAPMIQKGFEKMEKDEPNTYQIDIDEKMTKQDVFKQAQKLLGLK